jgi:asparagine synthase (glutamine-hydrolysing)
MCGFLGEFLFDSCNKTNFEVFKDLLRLSKHRGPDATQFSFGEYYQLGFNRLAILDLSKQGNQPKISPSKRYEVVFNGEIYNYKELQKKHKIVGLQSSSDTEVLVHLLDYLGVEETIKELNGMFAIGIIDLENDQLFLARDFAGIKPLFYGVDEQGIVFASQFNQVMKHPLFRNSLSLRKDMMKEYFGLGYMQAPNTIYSTIFQVNPGEIIQFDLNKLSSKHSLCSFSKEFVEGDDITNKIAQSLKESVEKQLVSDVPLATFLSGGIDSPLISALAVQQKATIEAFTLSVGDDMLDESKIAIAYASHLKLNHHIEHLGSRDVLEQVDHHFEYLTEPFGDYSSVPTYTIAKTAAKKYTVMLSGDGGDELFFGYPRMQDILRKKKWFIIPYVLRKPLVRIGNKLGLMNTWAPYSNRTMEEFVIAKQLHITRQKLNRLFPNVVFSKETKALFELPKIKTKKNILHWLRWNEFYGHLQRVLVKVDRMSMANSLEVRVPLLEKKIIESSWGVLPNIKGNNFRLKGVLKDLLGNFIPNKIISKTKKGFSVPIDDWLKNELKSDVEKVIFETPIYGNALMDGRELKNYISAYFDGKHNESWGVWHVYAWQKWAMTEGLI